MPKKKEPSKTQQKRTKKEKNQIKVTPKSDIKGTVKDSVFCDLFKHHKYALQLYQALHPEDTTVTEADIGTVTIHNIFTDQEYNDLGMTIREKLLILLEAQSTWSINIVVRILLYLAHTWNEYIETTNQNRYGSQKLNLPKPEFYVLYTGNRKTRPEWITLSDIFFDGEKDFLEVKVKMLYGEDKDDIISQYVNFTKVYHEQVKLYGKTRKAVVETIHICKDKNVLKEYLESREKEVIDIMMALFDQEKAMEQFMKQFAYEKKQEGLAEGLAEGLERGLTEKAKKTALNMKKKGYSDTTIADLLEVSVTMVQQWFSGTNIAKP